MAIKKENKCKRKFELWNTIKFLYLAFNWKGMVKSMNMRGLTISVLYFFLILITVSMPIYGKESSLNGNGNIKGIGEQITNLKSDYDYLENEIHMLLEECK